LAAGCTGVSHNDTCPRANPLVSGLVGLEGHNPNRVTLIEGMPINLTNARGVADATPRTAAIADL
jgi:hypothetical protein